MEPSRDEKLYDCPKNEWFFDTKIKIHPDPMNLSSRELQLIQNTPFLTYSRYFCTDRIVLQHHEIGEVLLFPDIIGKITWKIVGLYAETKLDKVVYKYEQIGIERRDIAKGPQFWW